MACVIVDRLVVPAVVGVLALASAGAGEGAAAQGAPAAKAPAAKAPEQKAPAAGAPASEQVRDALLEQAFEIASSIPVTPHARDRARVQEDVALGALRLGLLDQARRYAVQIEGWRGGEAMALIGRAHAARGDQQRARECATVAALLVGSERSWQNERVLALLACLWLDLGDDAQAAKLVADLSPEHLGTYQAARTARIPDAALEAQLAVFDAAVASGSFDVARTAVDGYAALLARSTGDAQRREAVLASARRAIKSLPLDLQVSRSASLAEELAGKGMTAPAQALLADATAVYAQVKWDAEDFAPLGAELVRARIALGDREGARTELRRLGAELDRVEPTIVNLRRGISLRALAEAWALLGDAGAARALYARALEAGALNPNSRPRAEDLSATCLSLGVARVEPTPEMTRRIEQIRAALADPW